MRRRWLRGRRAVNPAALPAPLPGADPDDAPTDRLQLGAAAERLLTDPVLALAKARVERDLIAAWRNTQVGAAAEREAAYQMIYGLEAVMAKLRQIAGDAKMLRAEQTRRDAEERAQNARRDRVTGLA